MKWKFKEKTLFFELSDLIDQSQHQLAMVATSALALFFWKVGHRINQDIRQYKRAGYAKQIVLTIAA